jgi:thiosulfate/3-mercaptopyruvate sulfurtransferase
MQPIFLCYPLRILLFAGLLSLQQHTLADTRISTNWLGSHLNDTNLTLIDMADDVQYQRFHLPGALHLPYRAINTTDRYGASYSSGREQLINVLGLLGVSPESHVVIYDDLGGLNASRLYWELEGLGHQRVSVLDGGLVQWVLEGRKVSNQAVNAIKTNYTPANKQPRANLATLADISQLSADAILLDVRTQEEYAGDPRQPRSGHIPGARWWPWDSTVDFNAGFRLKPAAELKHQLQSLGVSDPDLPVYLYCRTGHRASQSYYVLRQLGFSKVKIYDGSIAEYSRHTTLPLRKGMRP